MNIKSFLICFGMVSGLVAGVYASSAAKSDATPNAAPTLEFLKNLAGDWLKIDDDGNTTEEVVSSMRVTAGGSAVHEVLFPGTDHEMVTMYHQDGNDLVLTHYCVAGNQPRMKAERGSGPGKLVFKCTGGTNMKSEDDEHMHEGRITRIDENHINVEWLQFTKGKHTYTASFKLVRKKD